MNIIKNSLNIQNNIKKAVNKFPEIETAIKLINNNNGKAYLVGGAVRDAILNLEIKDIDIEVHNISFDKLYEILSSLSPVSLVGTSFGVLKAHNLPVDWSLPRTDSYGRKPSVSIDPFMTIEQALLRRDVTMNAMAINLNSFELIDPFGGLQDLENKILRSPDIKFFTQDPLRFYRVMQFISRFEMKVDDTLNNVCKTMDIKNISIERIEAEFEKMVLKSKIPSLGLRWLKSINRLQEILPQLSLSQAIKQDAIWHPEGDVFEHSMQTLDACSILISSKIESIADYKDNDTKLISLYASLFHDIGKLTTTKIINGRIKSPGHAHESAILAATLLKRITTKHKLIESICILIKYHMQPGQFVEANSTMYAYKRLANKLAKENTTMAMLADLAIADNRGRNGNGHMPLTHKVEFVDEFIKRAKEANVLEHPISPILFGRDIMDLVNPGPQMGKLLKWAYEQQIKKDIKEKSVLKELVTINMHSI